MGMVTRVAIVLSTVFGAGYFPLAPGTFASALTVLACAALGQIGRGPLLLAAAAVLSIPAVWAAGVAERAFGQRDPGRVVVDEVIGQMITLAALPPPGGAGILAGLNWPAGPGSPLRLLLAQWGGGMPALLGGWKYWLAGFILFRFFDITKPFPARRSERLPGGIGIVTDDVVAGAYGFLVLKLGLALGL